MVSHWHQWDYSRVCVWQRMPTFKRHRSQRKFLLPWLGGEGSRNGSFVAQFTRRADGNLWCLSKRVLLREYFGGVRPLQQVSSSTTASSGARQRRTPSAAFVPRARWVRQALILCQQNKSHSDGLGVGGGATGLRLSQTRKAKQSHLTNPRLYAEVTLNIFGCLHLLLKSTSRKVTSPTSLAGQAIVCS